GAIMLVLCGFGYAKPVAVNPYNFRRMKPKGGMAVTALAGPLSNLLMAYAALLVFRIYLLISGGDILTAGNTVYLDSELTKYLYLIFVDVFAGINIGLAVFNLLPIPPLDGSRIFSVLLPDKWVFALERCSRYITMGIFVLLFTGVLDVPLDFLRHWIGGLLCLLTGLPNLF
ncbi:MAG: site-2 protease family protein, partial [Clostridia bacterium]|nr:site-2 protease family protein [Clostridia bacterium]